MREIQCGDCGEVMAESVADVQRAPCVACGSYRRCINISIVDTIQFKEMIEAKAKDPTRTGKKAIRIEQMAGDNKHLASGKWYKKVRIIDRENDHYLEEITDPETGKVIHRCEEPLSQHYGHGSDKQQP